MAGPTKIELEAENARLKKIISDNTPADVAVLQAELAERAAKLNNLRSVVDDFNKIQIKVIRLEKELESSVPLTKLDVAYAENTKLLNEIVDLKDEITRLKSKISTNDHVFIDDTVHDIVQKTSCGDLAYDIKYNNVSQFFTAVVIAKHSDHVR